jgi:hypothetical protein
LQRKRRGDRFKGIGKGGVDAIAGHLHHRAAVTLDCGPGARKKGCLKHRSGLYGASNAWVRGLQASVP